MSDSEALEYAAQLVDFARQLGGPIHVTPEWSLRIARAAVSLQRERDAAITEIVRLRDRNHQLERELADTTALAKAIARGAG